MARKNVSSLWNFFEKNESTVKATCLTCKQEISYKSTIANLKSHLQRKHVSVYCSLLSSSEQQVSNIGNPQKLTTVVSNDTIEPNHAEGGPSTSAESSSAECVSPTKHSTSVPLVLKPIAVKRQCVMDSYIPKKISNDQKKQIDKDLMNLFIDGFQPFSLVEERSFKKFAKWIPGYNLPSRKTVSNSMLSAAFEQTKDDIKGHIATECDTVCVTTDLWSSRLAESYIAVTGHYISKDFKFKSVLLECCYFSGNHTSENISNELNKIVQDWGLKGKVNFAVSDNASNVTKAIKDDLQWNHFGCYAHTLNLVVDDALKLCSEEIEKVKRIVKYFKKSTVASEKLLKYQIQEGKQPKRLKQAVDNRWNSTYYMLERFVQIQEAVRATIALTGKNLPLITNDDLTTFQQLCRVLKPFEEMTASMSGEKYMTGSSVIVVTRCLSESCNKLLKEDFCPLVSDVVLELKRGLTDRFKGIESNSTLSLCTFLDPRYKIQAFENQSEDSESMKAKEIAQQLIMQEMKKSSSNPQQVSSPEASNQDEFSPWTIFDNLIGEKTKIGTPLSRASKELQMYLNDDILPRKKPNGEWNCPLDWWKNHQHVYPNLCEIFRKHCNIVGTSVPCERMFSKTGMIISDRRTRITSRKVEQLMFLNINMDESRFKW